MQKNESLLLEPWLVYHGHLFGYENLYVYDNGSDLDVVKNVLMTFERQGVNVYWDKNSHEDFEMKGHIIGDIVKNFQKDNSYDLVVPLDCDEFFAISGERGLTTDRAEILEYLHSIGDTMQAPDMTHGFWNWPGHLDLFIVGKFEKSIIPVRNFQEIDLGFHQVLLSEPHGRFRSRAVYFHLHYKPIEMIKKSASEKLKLRLDMNDPDAVRTYDGVGVHLARYLTMTRESYCSLIANQFPLVATRNLTETLERLGVYRELEAAWCGARELYARQIGDKTIVPLDGNFDRESYLRRYPDIRAAGVDPMLHFVQHGFGEGRTMR